MEIKYEDLTIKKNFLMEGGTLKLDDNGCCILKGKNGVGKTLFLKKLHSILFENSILVDQSNDEIITKATVLQNISMSNDAKRNQEIKNTLSSLGLDKILRLIPSKLSGGEKRLICILRGIFSSADIIIIDEPSNDLDYKHVELVKQLIEEIKGKRLVILATHDERFDPISDTILQIEDKKLVVKRIKKNVHLECQDTNDKIINQENYERLSIITKIAPKGITSIASYFVVLIMFLYIMYSALNVTLPEAFDNISENQINLFVETSQMADAIRSEGVFEGKLISSVLEGNIPQLMKEISFEENAESLNNLYIFLKDNYRILPMEFYDVDNRQITYSIDEYKKETSNLNIILDTTDYFESYNEEEGGHVESIDYEDFLAFLNRFATNKIEANENVTFVSIILDNKADKMKLLHNQEFAKYISEDGIFFQSSETVEVFRQIQEIQQYISSIQLVLLLSVIYSVICIVYDIMYLHSVKNIMTCFFNYGIELKLFRREFLKNDKSRFLFLFAPAGLFLLQFIYMNMEGINISFIAFCPIIVFGLFGYFVFIMKRRLYYIYSRRAYNWRTR